MQEMVAEYRRCHVGLLTLE